VNLVATLDIVLMSMVATGLHVYLIIIWRLNNDVDNHAIIGLFIGTVLNVRKHIFWTEAPEIIRNFNVIKLTLTVC